MSTENKITIRKWIEKNPEIAKMLKMGSTANEAVLKMASDTGISEIFIEQNLQTIRNWI